ncbi:MAG TPA: porin family protein [Gemmatimonadota bacterium]|nr:porin family protein [Gemmatimonadota bacterium]
MKRFATVICAVVLALGLAFTARPAQAQSIGIGVQGGASFSDFNVSDPSVDLSSRTGYRIAGVVRIGLGGVLGLESGVGLVQKGSVEPASSSGLTSDLNYNVDYIDIPLLLTLSIPTGPAPIHPRLFAGPQANFQSSCSISFSSASTDCTDSNGLATKSTTWGLVFGGGLDFPVGGPLALTVDGRYELGLTDINDTTDPNATSVKNRSFVISGGLLLTLP